ncbi:MAG: hypothetical protein L0154_28245 [Chloroflexi bacterium]|nr:hypothetical protein [Chloroflexota bacterium]
MTVIVVELADAVHGVPTGDAGYRRDSIDAVRHALISQYVITTYETF